MREKEVYAENISSAKLWYSFSLRLYFSAWNTLYLNVANNKMRRERLNEIGAIILDACITVHRELGPGLLESAYEISLKQELELRGLNVRAQVSVHLNYKGADLGKAYTIDLLIEEEIIIEAKAVEIMHPVYQAQIITYLKLYGKHLGYLVNFNVPLLKDGFKRIVYQF